MVAKFEVAGVVIDTYGEEDVVYSSAVNDIGEIQRKGGVWSNTFKIPYTGKNAQVFGHPEQILSDSDKPYGQLPLIVYVDDNPQVFGHCEVTAASEVYYEISFYSSNFDWSAQILDKTLFDLGIHDLDHKYTLDNVYDNRNVTWDNGYIYPNINYGLITTATPPNVHYTYLKPSLFIKYLLIRMLEFTGYEVQGDVLTNPKLEKEIITWDGTGHNVHSEYWMNKYAAKGARTAPEFFPGAAPNVYYPTLQDTDPNGYDNNNMWDNSLKAYVVTQNMVANVRMRATLIPFGGDARVAFAHGVDAPPPISAPVPDADVELGVTSGVYSVDVTVENIFLAEGEYIYLVTSSFDIDYTLTDVSLEIMPQAEFRPESDMEVGNFFGHIKCADILRLVFNQYCVLVKSDNYAKVVTLNYFDGVVDKIPLARDWSEKVDRSEKMSVKNQFLNYGQKSIFRYSPDDTDEYYTKYPNYGRGIITVADNRLDAEKDVFVTPFALMHRGQAMTSLEMGIVTAFKDGEVQRCLPRIALVEFNDQNQITIGDGTTTKPLETLQPSATGAGLEFQVLIVENYETLTGLLFRPKVLSLAVKLTPADMILLDHEVPVWISWLGAFFYVNLVNQYKLNKVDSTFVELVRLS